MTEPRIGYCLGTVARPHRQVEWQGCYTICTICNSPLRYNTVENVEHMTGLTRPAWWTPERVIGYTAPGGCALDTDGDGNCPMHPGGCPPARSHEQHP